MISQKAQKKYSDKWMILLFPLITLGLFLAAIIAYHFVPIILSQFH